MRLTPRDHSSQARHLACAGVNSIAFVNDDSLVSAVSCTEVLQYRKDFPLLGDALRGARATTALCVEP